MYLSFSLCASNGKPILLFLVFEPDMAPMKFAFESCHGVMCFIDKILTDDCLRGTQVNVQLNAFIHR